MNLAVRDHKIIQLKAELDNRKKILCMKRHQLKSNMRENSYLKEVANDYDKYNNHIIFDNINSDLTLTNNKLKDSKQDQREIMKEITYLKNELDDLVDNNSEYINSNSNIDE